MITKNIIYVDDRDRVVGSGSIEEALKGGHAVRIVRIFIADIAGKILIQKRSNKVKNSALKWDQSAGGHVDEGESYLEAARRELFEEMGIIDVRLKKICKYFTNDTYGNYTRKRYNIIYNGTYDGEVIIDNNEVSDYRWLTLNELDTWIANSRQDFTNGFIEAYSKYRQLNF